jgi:hypothetical protein
MISRRARGVYRLMTKFRLVVNLNTAKGPRLEESQGNLLSARSVRLRPVNGGRVVEIHRDWAGIELAGNGSQRTFDRRRVGAAKIILPWAAHDRSPRNHRS